MKWHSWLIVGILTALLLVVDVAAAWIWHYNFMSDDWRWLFVLVVGGSTAQVNLIAIWASLAPGRVALRLPWSIFLTTLMWYALIIGNLLENTWAPSLNGGILGPSRGPTLSQSDAVLLGLILLVGVVTVQVSLWAMSRWVGWRLYPPRSEIESLDSERQFNLRHLIAGMVLASLALGLGRILLPAGEWTTPSLDGELTVILPALLIVNLVAIVPCIWVAFARMHLLPPLTFLWLLWAVFVSLIEIAILSALLGPPPGNVWFYFTLFNLAQGTCVLGSLLVLRLAGFQLMRRQVEEKILLSTVTAIPPSDIMQPNELPPTTTTSAEHPR